MKAAKNPFAPLRREKALDIRNDENQQTEQDRDLDHVIEEELNAAAPAGSGIKAKRAQASADQSIEPLHAEDLILNESAHKKHFPYLTG